MNAVEIREAFERADRLINWMAGYIGKMAPGKYGDCYADLNEHGLFMSRYRANPRPVEPAGEEAGDG